MNSAALTFMLITLGLVTGMTLYFFIKVLKVPPRPNPVNTPEQSLGGDIL
jgi:hypothetical protein